MPTSRYCDHWPRATSASFNAMASAEPGRSRDRSEPIRPCRRSRIASAWPASPPASSSIRRSSRLTAKVTPAAFTGCRSQGASRRAGPPARLDASQSRASPSGSPGADRARSAGQQVGHGRRHGGDVEHPAAAHRHHAGAVLRRLAPDTADQQSAVQVGGQVMIGNSGSSHAGSLGPSFVRSWSGPRRDAPGTASESRSGLP